MAALVERSWLLGRDDDRLDGCRSLLDDARVGLEWARGELAVWLRRLDPDLGLGDVEGVAEPYRLELAGKHREAAAAWAALSCPYERALALVDSGEVDDARDRPRRARPPGGRTGGGQGAASISAPAA